MKYYTFTDVIGHVHYYRSRTGKQDSVWYHFYAPEGKWCKCWMNRSPTPPFHIRIYEGLVSITEKEAKVGIFTLAL